MPTVLDAASSGSGASHWRSTGWRPAGRCRDLSAAVDTARPVHHGGRRNDIIEWEAQPINAGWEKVPIHMECRLRILAEVCHPLEGARRTQEQWMQRGCGILMW